MNGDKETQNQMRRHCGMRNGKDTDRREIRKKAQRNSPPFPYIFYLKPTIGLDSGSSPE